MGVAAFVDLRTKRGRQLPLLPFPSRGRERGTWRGTQCSCPPLFLCRLSPAPWMVVLDLPFPGRCPPVCMLMCLGVLSGCVLMSPSPSCAVQIRGCRHSHVIIVVSGGTRVGRSPLGAAKNRTLSPRERWKGTPRGRHRGVPPGTRWAPRCHHLANRQATRRCQYTNLPSCRSRYSSPCCLCACRRTTAAVVWTSKRACHGCSRRPAPSANSAYGRARGIGGPQ